MGPHSLNDGRCTSLLSRTKSVPAKSPPVMISMARSGMLRSISRATSAWEEDTWDGKVLWVQVTISYILPKGVSISFCFGRGCNPTVIHNDMCVCSTVCMYACTHVFMCACKIIYDMYDHVWPCMIMSCMYVCMHACMYECMLKYIYACMHVCKHVCMYICVCLVKLFPFKIGTIFMHFLVGIVWCLPIPTMLPGFHKLFSPWNSTRALGEAKSHLKIANFSGGKYYIKEVKS